MKNIGVHPIAQNSVPFLKNAFLPFVCRGMLIPVVLEPCPFNKRGLPDQQNIPSTCFVMFHQFFSILRENAGIHCCRYGLPFYRRFITFGQQLRHRPDAV